MRKSLRLLAVFAVLAVAATAGELRAQEGANIPKRFQPILDGYRGWSPQYLEEPYGSSIYNYAIHASETVPAAKDDYLSWAAPRVLSAAATWLFTRDANRLKVLAQAYGPQLKQIFEKLFRSKQLQIITSKSFNSKALVFYTAWYDCVASSKYPPYAGRETVGQDDVLRSLNSGGYDYANGIGGECNKPLTALSKFYDVQRLSTDQLTVVGFFARREHAHAEDASFISAEIVRKLVDDIFK